MNFRISFFYFCEECCWHFDGDYVQSIDGFGLYGHFTIFSKLISIQCLFYVCVLLVKSCSLIVQLFPATLPKLCIGANSL